MRAARAWHLATAAVSGSALLLQLAIVVFVNDNDTLSTRVIRLFSFFTIQSNLIVTAGAIALARNPARDGRAFRVVRLVGLVCISVTGLVYVSVLRGLYELGALEEIANIGLHYLTPLLAALGWGLFGPRPRIDPGTVGLTLLYPVGWLGYTLVRGEVTGWYPYPFVDVSSQGYPAVLVNCVLVTLVVLAVAGAFFGLDRRLPGAATAPEPQPSLPTGGDPRNTD